MEELLVNLKLYLIGSGTPEDELTGQDTFLTFLLTTAGQKILDKLYPFDSSVSTVPTRYNTKQIEIAVYLFNKRGAEGEVTHNENGMNRTYESADVPVSLMRGITPFVGSPITITTT